MRSDDGVVGLVEYVITTAILICLFGMVCMAADAIFMEGPRDALTRQSFTDIGGGVSVRVVDLYLTAPQNGKICTSFDIPDDVLGRDYSVCVILTGAEQEIVVTDGEIEHTVPLAGIGATLGVTGNMSASGWNRIRYDSEGV
ncbi:MAG: DUF7266 family protein [Methanoculleaceae archaeon]